MNSILFNEWKKMSHDLKIVYYPELFYVKRTAPSPWDIYDLEDSVHYHIRNFKILLLYFDLINLPFGHLYVPFDEYSAQLAYTLTADLDFRSLVDEELIIYSIGKYRDPLDYHEMITSELVHGGFVQVLTLSDEFRSIFKDLKVVERDIIQQNVSMYHEILRFLNQNPFPPEHLDRIKKALDIATSGGNYFMHELFVFYLQDPSFDRMHDLISTSYFKISEEGNFNTITYTPIHAERFGRIQRKDSTYNIYSFLYSPEFFLEFLNQYIDIARINFAGVKISSLRKILSHPSRDAFIREYHKMLGYISDAIEGRPSKELPQNALNALNTIRLRGNRINPLSWLILVANIYISNSLDSLFFASPVQMNFHKALSLNSLKIQNRIFYEYLSFIKSELEEA